jgi:hypothetical protein
MWLSMSWREKLFLQLVMQKMKHFLHEALFHVTVTILEVAKQREVNASEMHLRHSFPELLIIRLMNIDILS